jgi:hypothetical protein
VADEAFWQAGTLVALNAPGHEQLVAELGPGGDAVVPTECVYFNLNLSSVPLI